MSWPRGLNGWNRGRDEWSRLRRRAGTVRTGGATEQESSKDNKYAINLPLSIHRSAFVSQGEAAQYEP